MRLPLASGRTPNGLWADFQHLEAELRRFATQQAEQQAQQAQQAAHQQAAQAAAAATQPVLGPWRQAQQQQAQQQAEDAAEEAEWLAAATADDRPQASAWLPPWHAAASSSSSSTPGGGGGSSNSSSSGGATTTTTATSSSSTSSSSTSSSSSPGGGLLATGRRNLRYASRSWSSSGLGPADVALPSITMLAEDGSAARSADVPLSGGSGSGSSGSGGSGSDADTPRGASGAGSAGSAGSAAGFGSSGGLVFLPTQQELREAGRSDLIAAIRTHGGSLAVARRLGWAVHYGRLPSEAAVVQQLLLFVQAVHGRRRPKTGLLPMPTLRQLQEGGRVDLAGAVQRLGGVGVFAALLAGEQRRRRRALRPGVGGGQRQRHGGATAEEEAEEEEEEEGEGAAPQQLSHILAYPGGGRRLAPTPPQPAVVHVGQEVLQLIEARGWERRVPTKQVRGMGCWGGERALAGRGMANLRFLQHVPSRSAHRPHSSHSSLAFHAASPAARSCWRRDGRTCTPPSLAAAALKSWPSTCSCPTLRPAAGASASTRAAWLPRRSCQRPPSWLRGAARPRAPQRRCLWRWRRTATAAPLAAPRASKQARRLRRGRGGRKAPPAACWSAS